MIIPSAYRILTGDQIVNEGPTLWCGFILHVSVDGAGVHVYDGLDTLSGILAAHIVGGASDVNWGQFPFPILLNNGLFVDVGANVHHFMLNYIPLRGGSPLTIYPGFEIKSKEE